jgi:hypothetical protein
MSRWILLPLSCAIAFIAGSLYGQTKSDFQRAIESKPLPAASDQERIIAYWTSETDWKSELQLRNNQAKQDLTITPVLRLPNGTETHPAANEEGGSSRHKGQQVKDTGNPGLEKRRCF